MKTILSMLLLMCFALSAQTPPGEIPPPPPEAATAPAATGNTNAAAVPAFPSLPTPAPGPRRPRSDINRATRQPGSPVSGDPAVTQAAPPATNPTPGGVPAGAIPATPTPSPNAPPPIVYTSAPAAAPAAVAGAEEIVAAKLIHFTGADLGTVLQRYAELVGRSMLRSPTAETALKAPIFFVNQTPLTRSEAMQAYQAIAAMNGVALVEVDEKFMKVVTVAEALGTGQKPMITTNAVELAELGQFVTHIVQLKYVKPTEMMSVLTQFQSGKIPNAITAIDASQTLVMRDFTENVKRMLEMIERVDTSVQSEFASEVIPIKYAKAEDIASALSSLSGSGGATTVGTRSAGTGPAGAGTRPGLGGYGNQNMPGQMNTPGATQTGTPSATGSFSDRINRIIQNASRTSGSGDFQIIGPNKIVADVRANALIVFASHADMTTIKKIIGQLDVVLAQVLIETVIIDVTLGDSSEIGFSYLQRKASTAGGDFTGIGAIRNTSFLTGTEFGSSTNGAGGLLGGGFSYLASFGQDLDVTLTAIAGDNAVKVLQKPQIMTSHATAASVFIGSTVPYVSGTYYGGGYGGGPSSQYQQLKVGISLTVTPYINQDGLVVMQIDESIDEISGSIPIEGVGDVPTTTSRTLTAEVAVKDRETIVLGGFIRTSKSDGKSGVPYLKDIPWLGSLFSKTSKSQSRGELLVLMRPTVLRTPEIAAAHTVNEKARLPGIRSAEAEYIVEEGKRRAKANALFGPEGQPGDFSPAQEMGEPKRDDQGFLPPQ